MYTKSSHHLFIVDIQMYCKTWILQILTLRYVHILLIISFQGHVLCHAISKECNYFGVIYFIMFLLAVYSKQEKVLLTRLDHRVFYYLFMYASYSVLCFLFHAFFNSNKILLIAGILQILKFWKQKLTWQQRDSNPQPLSS